MMYLLACAFFSCSLGDDRTPCYFSMSVCLEILIFFIKRFYYFFLFLSLLGIKGHLCVFKPMGNVSVPLSCSAVKGGVLTCEQLLREYILNKAFCQQM